MMLRFVILLLCMAVLRAEQKCRPDSHGVRRYNGKPCASTTRYNDGHRGACGCGPPSSDTPFDWNMAELTTAPSQNFFDHGGSSQWCGRNCGKCVKLTPTGGFVPGQGAAPSNHAPRTFLVTNDCPVAGNEQWCGISGNVDNTHHNSHGYQVHFDLQNNRGQVNDLHWNNPEVTWEEVNCPSHFAREYRNCECD